jgi:hypothetical protein
VSTAQPPASRLEASGGGFDVSTSYLIERIGIIERAVGTLVELRRRGDPSAEDPFRGLYLSEDHVARLLADDAGAATAGRTATGGLAAMASLATMREGLDAEAASAERSGHTIRLRQLARRALLSELDTELLVVALAPDMDSRFERLYGYLNDDVTRRRATVGLALELAGASAWSADARSRLTPGSPLIDLALVQVEEPERPLLSRTLRVPDRVAFHLLGDDRPDPAVVPLVHRSSPPRGELEGEAKLARALRQGAGLVYLRERPGSSGVALATAALAGAGKGAVVVDLSQLDAAADVAQFAALVGREALLDAAGVVAGPVDALAGGGPATLRALSSMQVPLLLHGRCPWEPTWSTKVPLIVEVPIGSPAQRLAHWEAALGDEVPAGLEASDLTSQFALSLDQVASAARSARLLALHDGDPLSLDHLRSGARAQNGAGLERLARRIRPEVSWDDLVLAPATRESLEELAARARYRDRVLDEWGMRPGGGRGRGISALFAGDSGTGKTMSAEVVAHDLGLDLYAVNLATVVDKYVGETEKNLERIFTEAAGVNAVLLFDEADAIFGKRSEVKDANDRYANIEVAYLLQRMETFDGIALLATNLRANVDEAFARRLDMIVDFPSPDEGLRRALWERCLGAGVPRSGELDLDFCAHTFELSGGNIRSIAVTAAYLAASEGRPLEMADIIRAIQREYRKLGRLVVPGEFGAYYSLLAS